jgi:hypothetical protein
MHKVGTPIRHRVQDVRNEDYYWLPWDESMELAKKEEPKEKQVKSPAYVVSTRVPFVRRLNPVFIS